MRRWVAEIMKKKTSSEKIEILKNGQRGSRIKDTKFSFRRFGPPGNY